MTKLLAQLNGGFTEALNSYIYLSAKGPGFTSVSDALFQSSHPLTHSLPSGARAVWSM